MIFHTHTLLKLQKICYLRLVKIKHKIRKCTGIIQTQKIIGAIQNFIQIIYKDNRSYTYIEHAENLIPRKCWLSTKPQIQNTIIL